ncbi:hypothetical protein SUGI_0573660 [Cryptomeria japonica]|nr:hypothetical protein SUGI_0573660 [Cryptomeria japonica]
MEKGVFVSVIAGNHGPYSSTLSNTAPWMATVGASIIDRDFPASLVLGNQEIFRGTASTYVPVKRTKRYTKALPLVYVSTNKSSRRCLSGSLDPDLVKGKIVVCDQPLSYNAVVKSNIVAKERGGGVIVANERLMGTQQ